MDKSKAKKTNIKFQGEFIQRVSNIKYLGVYLNEKLDEKLNLMKRKNAYLLIRFNRLKPIRIQDFNVSFEVKLYFYKTFIRPLLMYGIEIMKLYETQTRKLQTLESKMVKSMFGVKINKRSTKLLTACNIDTIKNRMTTMKTKMTIRVNKN